MAEVETRDKYFQKTFIKERILGNGVSGHVVKVRNKNDLTKVSAIKKMYDDHGQLEVYMLRLLHEDPLALKYIIEYMDAWIDLGRSFYIQMECCEMDLKSLLDKTFERFHTDSDPKMSCIEFFIYCLLYRKILACVNYIHTHLPPVIHCDLHSKNILVKIVDKKLMLKLADFAFSIVQDQPDQRQTDTVQLGKLIRQLFKYDRFIENGIFEDRYKKIDQISRELLDKNSWKVLNHGNLEANLTEWELTAEQLRTEFSVDKIKIENYNNSSDRLFYLLLNEHFS